MEKAERPSLHASAKQHMLTSSWPTHSGCHTIVWQLKSTATECSLQGPTVCRRLYAVSRLACNNTSNLKCITSWPNNGLVAGPKMSKLPGWYGNCQYGGWRHLPKTRLISREGKETWASASGALWTHPSCLVWTNELMTGYWSSTDESFRNHLGWTGAPYCWAWGRWMPYIYTWIWYKIFIHCVLNNIFLYGCICRTWAARHSRQGIQSVLLSGKKTLTQLTMLELLSASKGLQQTQDGGPQQAFKHITSHALRLWIILKVLNQQSNRAAHSSLGL